MFSVLRKISAFAGSRRGLLKKSMLVAFLGAVFTAFQFWALMLTLEILVGGANLSIWPVIGIMLVSVAGRTACSYWSTNAETETGYFMVAEKRVHIGDRLRYIPMGYFNDNSLGNITAVVTTTLGDVENNAARCLVSVIGGFLNTLAMCLAILLVDWRLGLLAIAGILAYLGVEPAVPAQDRPCPPARPDEAGGGSAGVHPGYERGQGLWTGQGQRPGRAENCG